MSLLIEDSVELMEIDEAPASSDIQVIENNLTGEEIDCMYRAANPEITDNDREKILLQNPKIIMHLNYLAKGGYIIRNKLFNDSDAVVRSLKTEGGQEAKKTYSDLENVQSLSATQNSSEMESNSVLEVKQAEVALIDNFNSHSENLPISNVYKETAMNERRVEEKETHIYPKKMESVLAVQKPSKAESYFSMLKEEKALSALNVSPECLEKDNIPTFNVYKIPKPIKKRRVMEDITYCNNDNLPFQKPTGKDWCFGEENIPTSNVNQKTVNKRKVIEENMHDSKKPRVQEPMQAFFTSLEGYISDMSDLQKLELQRAIINSIMVIKSNGQTVSPH